MSHGGPHKKVANSLVALSSAAVLAVYSAGYVRTRPAADRFAQQAAERRPAAPPPPAASAPAAEVKPEAASVLPPSASPVRQHDTPLPAIAAKPLEPASDTKEIPGAAVEPAVNTPPATVPAAPETPSAIVEAKAEGPSAAPTAAPAAPAVPAPPVWKDGTYTGWGNSRHGSIQAAVLIESGRIASATIAQCLTRYSCSVIDRLPPQVAQRQSPEVDYVSGATQSANAFYYAVVEALSKAK